MVMHFIPQRAFATFQSGNIILVGYTLATHETEKLIHCILSIFCFGFGSMATVILRNIHNRMGKVWTFKVLALEICILNFIVIVTNIWNDVWAPFQIVLMLAFIAGLQGNAFHKIGEMLYGNIAVTLNVQLVFNFVAEIFFQKNKKTKSELKIKAMNFFLVLIAFAAGASGTALLTKHFGTYALIFTILPLVAIYITGLILHAKKPAMPIDSN